MTDRTDVDINEVNSDELIAELVERGDLPETPLTDFDTDEIKDELARRGESFIDHDDLCQHLNAIRIAHRDGDHKAVVRLAETLYRDVLQVAV